MRIQKRPASAPPRRSLSATRFKPRICTFARPFSAGSDRPPTTAATIPSNVKTEFIISTCCLPNSSPDFRLFRPQPAALILHRPPVADYGCAGAGAGAVAGLLVSKFTLGACRAPSSVLKYASLRVNPANPAIRLFGNNEIYVL